MKIIMRVCFGSRLYGTQTPTSDTDYKSVFIPDARDIIMQNPVCRGVISNKTKADTTQKNSADDIDDELFSLFKFMNMLKVGDMIASELLFAPKNNLIKCTPEWEYIVDNRDRLINKEIRGFLGYCTKQAAKYGVKGSRVASVRAAIDFINDIESKGNTPLSGIKLGEIYKELEVFCETQTYSKIVDVLQPSGNSLKHWEVCDRKMPYTVSLKQCFDILSKVFYNYGQRALMAEKNEGVDWKAMSHAVRVGEQAIELVTTKNISFPRPNIQELLDIKLGKIPYAQVAERLENLLDEVNEKSLKSSLPDVADIPFMEETIYRFYRRVVYDSFR